MIERTHYLRHSLRSLGRDNKIIVVVIYFAKRRTVITSEALRGGQEQCNSEMDTGRVDPRVGSGRVEISEMHYFFSLSVGLSKLSYCSQH